MKTWIVLYKSEDVRIPDFFKCKSDDEQHAIKQCENFFEGCEILQVKQTEVEQEVLDAYWQENGD